MPKPKTLRSLRRAIRHGAYADDRFDPFTRSVLFLSWLYDYGQLGDMPPERWVCWREPERWVRDLTGHWRYHPAGTGLGLFDDIPEEEKV